MKLTEPTAWQKRVLSIPADVNLALFGGRGSGKTTALEFLILRHCETYGAKARTLVVRSTFQSLKNLWDDLTQLFDTALPGSSQNKADHVIKTPAGAVVTLTNLEDDRDVRKLQGQECNLLIVDECTNFPSLQRILKLQANLRGPADVPVRTIYAGNPGGPLHAVIALKFVTGRTPWAPFRIDDGSEWVYCPSTYKDNPALDRERYAKQIETSAGGDRALAAAWLSNDWSELGGAFFADVWGDHLLIDDYQFRIPKHWEVCVSLDWGMTAPAVALLGVKPRPERDDGYILERGSIPRRTSTVYHQPGPSWPRDVPAGSWLILDEVHTARADEPSLGKGWAPQMLAEEIVSACKRRGIKQHGVCDDARGLQGDTLIEQFRQWGLWFRKPTKDRISGWVKLKSMMAATRDRTSAPRLYISRRCKLTIQTLPMLPRDDTRIEDVDMSANDHAADALRYLVNSETKYVGQTTHVGL